MICYEQSATCINYSCVKILKMNCAMSLFNTMSLSIQQSSLQIPWFVLPLVDLPHPNKLGSPLIRDD